MGGWDGGGVGSGGGWGAEAGVQPFGLKEQCFALSI